MPSVSCLCMRTYACACVRNACLCMPMHAYACARPLRRYRAVLQKNRRTHVCLCMPMHVYALRRYRAVLEKNRRALGGAANARGLVNVLASLRKCSNHPYLFSGAEPEPFEEGAYVCLCLSCTCGWGAEPGPFEKGELLITCHLSPVTYHLPPITCHLSPITCHLSPITYHLSLLSSPSHHSPLPLHPHTLSPLILCPFTHHTSPFTLIHPHLHLSPLTFLLALTQPQASP